MLTTAADRSEILLPQYRDVVVEQRARDYLVDGQSYRRVSSVLGVINKPALVGWAVKTTLERVEEVMRSAEVALDFGKLAAETVTNVERHGITGRSNYEEFVDRLMTTAKKAANERRDAAADRGTNVHEEIRAVLEGTQPGERVISPQTDQALAFLDDYPFEVSATEYAVWNDDLQVAGTCDVLGVNARGAQIVWDWKTGSGPWWEMALQLGAYAGMVHRLTGEPVADAYIVKLLEDRYEVHRVSDLRLAWEAFEHAAKLQTASKVDWWQ